MYRDDPIPNMDNEDDPITDAYHAELMEFLVHNPSMRKTAQQSLKQGLYTGGAALTGAALFGPVGGLVGGIAGSVLGFVFRDKDQDYDGIVQQLLKIPSQSEKEKLISQVRTVLTNAGATVQQFESSAAFQAALVQFASQRAVRDQVWKACVECMQNQNQQ